LAGKFFVCATPIGNLEDVSLRLLSVLKEVDLILAEDTRRTMKLLKHYCISKPLKCLEKHREKSMLSWVLDQLRLGMNIALVSDAGTPGVSDPGVELIPFLIRENIQVDYIPGPSSVISSLILSGLPLHTFLFHAYPPSRPGARRKLYESLKELKATLIFFESPNRLIPSLNDMLETFGDRRAAVCRELTKIHQEILRGTLTELLITVQAKKSLKGEVTLVVEGKPKG